MKLRICRACCAKNILLPLAIVALFLFGQTLYGYYNVFREFQTALLSVQWMLLVCLSLWCVTFIFLTFSLKDLPLIGLLLIAIATYFIGTADHPAADAIILLAGVTLGRGTQFLLQSRKRKAENQLETPHVISYFLIWLIVLLAFAAWWHLDMAGAYHGPRWMGLWNNPNIYGMLMGAGVVLAIGLLAAKRRKRHKNNSISPETSQKLCSSRGDEAQTEENLVSSHAGCYKENPVPSPWPFLRILCFIAAKTSWFLIVATVMMAVGLLFSYSRGAWLGTAVGLLYLAWAYGKFKWRYVMLGAGLVALGALCLWGRTADTGPWYLKRLDFSRPSAQHRVSAWRGALQIMWDHPLGVGWNQAVATYDKNYSPPEGGAPALTTNSYLMLGTELGLPGLLCFVAYVGLCFKTNRRHLTPALSPFDPSAPVKRGEGELARSCDALVAEGVSDASSLGLAATAPSILSRDGGVAATFCDEASQLRCACRAGAVVLLVAFWFDGGLFDLPTAAVFWVLLELGAERQKRPALLRSKPAAPALPAKA
jgi:O-antigen ligase